MTKLGGGKGGENWLRVPSIVLLLEGSPKTDVLGDTLERSVSVLSLYLAVTSEKEETLSAYPVVILLSLGPKDEKKNYDLVSRSITMATH